MQDTASDLVLAWHWLTTQDHGTGGLDHLFTTVRKLDTSPEFQDRCRRDSWEVVLPELVFAP